jgi:hypothetical protein
MSFRVDKPNTILYTIVMECSNNRHIKEVSEIRNELCDKSSIILSKNNNKNKRYHLTLRTIRS